MPQEPGDRHGIGCHALFPPDAVQHGMHRRALRPEEPPARKRRPGHDRHALFLHPRDLAISERRVVQHAQFDLVGGKRRFHRRLQQRPVVALEVRHAHGAHLARCHQRVERMARFLVVHQRIGPVDQQQVDRLDPHGLQRMFDRGGDMGGRGVVVFHPPVGVTAHGRDDVAFRDDLDPVAQARCRAERIAQDRLGGVAAIDVGLVHRGDALGQARFDLGLHMRGRSIGIIAEPPHAVDDARQVQRADLDPIHGLDHQRLSPVPKGVAGGVAGTRP